MKGFVGVTDNDWFDFLSRQPEIDEINFWQPGGRGQFRALKPGEPFFFKLHSPYNFIVGGGFFVHSTILPVSLAWQAFGEKNGASSYLKMRKLIERRRRVSSKFEDYQIGCIVLTQPFFFEREDWIPVPKDFKLNIVKGKTYDLDYGQGRSLWEQVQVRSVALNAYSIEKQDGIAESGTRYGEPIVVIPRLGQGGFRIMVADAYRRRCAITQEKILPALEAAHIRPFSENGPHSVKNGILLRSDIHRLFDSGYVTVTTNHCFEVSRRIKEEFDNGEHYRVFHGHGIHLPPEPQFNPSPEFLRWHNENVFKE